MAFLVGSIKQAFQFALLVPLIVYGYLKLFMTLLLVPKKYRIKKYLNGQTVLITGAGSGLGRQMAIAFSKHSTRLVLLDINKSSLLDTQGLLNPDTNSFVYHCDVSDRRKVYEVADLIREDVGKVDVLINNAGMVSGKSFLDIPDESLLKTMEVNVIAHFWTCKAFLPAMVEANKGHIVSIASIAGKTASAKITDYCASKYAAVGFMESLSMELEAQGVTGVKMTTICPTVITTGLFEGSKAPFNLSLTPEYVAEATIQAIMEESEVVVLPRSLWILVIMHTILPASIRKIIQRRTGILYVMDEFKGRDKSTNNNNKQK